MTKMVRDVFLLCSVLKYFSLLKYFVVGNKALVNIALHKPASQSSTYSNSLDVAVAGRAVDGVAKSRFKARSCTHTNENEPYPSNPWWEVDLQNLYKIGQVRILNRNICEERLHDIKVEVFENKSGNVKKKHCFTHRGPAVAGWLNLSCECPVRGRFVRISKPKLNKDDVLTLCEVEIYETQENFCSMNLKRTSTLLMLGQGYDVQTRSLVHCGTICGWTSGCRGFNVTVDKHGHFICHILTECLDKGSEVKMTNETAFVLFDERGTC